MDKFAYLTRRRQKALGLFSKVVNQLEHVKEEIKRAITASESNIDQHQGTVQAALVAIDSEKASIDWLKAEFDRTHNSRQSVAALME